MNDRQPKEGILSYLSITTPIIIRFLPPNRRLVSPRGGASAAPLGYTPPPALLNMVWWYTTILYISRNSCESGMLQLYPHPGWYGVGGVPQLTTYYRYSVSIIFSFPFHSVSPLRLPLASPQNRNAIRLPRYFLKMGEDEPTIILKAKYSQKRNRTNFFSIKELDAGRGSPSGYRHYGSLLIRSQPKLIRTRLLLLPTITSSSALLWYTPTCHLMSMKWTCRERQSLLQRVGIFWRLMFFMR